MEPSESAGASSATVRDPVPVVGRMKPYAVRRNGTVLDRAMDTVVGFVWQPKRGTWHGRLSWSNVPLVTTASHRDAAVEVVWAAYKTGLTTAFAMDATGEQSDDSKGA